MKKLILLTALALGACASPPPIRCLNEGQAARILEIEVTDRERGDDYTTFTLTTDNKTVRVCRANNTNVQMLKKGQVIRGFSYQDNWSFINWYRIA